MWLAANLSSNALNYLKNTESMKNILKIIDCIEDCKWNRAKTIWLFDICQRKKNSSRICTFGSEYEHFTQFIAFMQTFKSTEICEICNLDQSPKEQNYLFFTKEHNDIILNLQEELFCKTCQNKIHRKIAFLSGEPAWLVCEIQPNIVIDIEMLPKQLVLNEAVYKLLCATFNNGMCHFISIFFLNNSYFVVNDMQPKKIEKTVPNNNITTCLYYLH